MILQKKKRIINKGLLKELGKKNCAVCGLASPNDCHHIKSKGSGGDDIESNILVLCRLHHQEAHKIGRKSFFKKYPYLSLKNKNT